MTPDELSRRLAPIQAKRGYLLPHHGLLAVTSPNLLQAYDQLYTAIALDPKTLSVRDRELVWLAVLIATDEALATHHIAHPQNFSASTVLTVKRFTSPCQRWGSMHRQVRSTPLRPLIGLVWGSRVRFASD